MSYIPSGTGTPIFEQLCREHAAEGRAHPVYAQAQTVEVSPEQGQRARILADTADAREAPQPEPQEDAQTDRVPAHAQATPQEQISAQSAPAQAVPAQSAPPARAPVPAQAATAAEVAKSAQVAVQTQQLIQPEVTAPAQRGSHAALAQRATRERVA
jgi:hypothetical protein